MGSTIDSVSNRHPDGHGSIPRGGNIPSVCDRRISTDVKQYRLSVLRRFEKIIPGREKD